MDKNNVDNRGFRTFGILTVVAVYFLILVGGIVRSTGSGMGCPDWPKCFGSWVPPTSLDQLPADYKEIYAEKRLEKNKRVAATLSGLGFHELSDKLIHDESLYVEADFNPVKTWIEYVNRLVGVTIGLLIFGTLLFSFPLRKTSPDVFWYSVAAFVLVLFEGWLGSLVVSTNLMPFMVSIHMGLAIVLVFVLIMAVFKAGNYAITLPSGLNYSNLSGVLLVTMLATFVQIIIGTQVREEVDIIAVELTDSRSLWISNLGNMYLVHRLFSYVLLALHIWLCYLLMRKLFFFRKVRISMIAILCILGLSIVTGNILNYMDLPAAIQPVHLLLACMLSGVQFLLYLLVVTSKKVI